VFGGRVFAVEWVKRSVVQYDGRLQAGEGSRDQGLSHGTFRLKFQCSLTLPPAFFASPRFAWPPWGPSRAVPVPWSSQQSTRYSRPAASTVTADDR